MPLRVELQSSVKSTDSTPPNPCKNLWECITNNLADIKLSTLPPKLFMLSVHQKNYLIFVKLTLTSNPQVNYFHHFFVVTSKMKPFDLFFILKTKNNGSIRPNAWRHYFSLSLRFSTNLQKNQLCLTFLWNSFGAVKYYLKFIVCPPPPNKFYFLILYTSVITRYIFFFKRHRSRKDLTKELNNLT